MSSMKKTPVPGDAETNSAPTWQKDFLSSVVVFLVALPLCMGVAIASNAPVSTGLVTGIVGGLLVSQLAGCPLQVSGPTASLSVLVFDAINRYGLEMLGLIVVIAGLIQLLAGITGAGQWFRAVSPAVVIGMLSGIGVLIFTSQFHVMLDDVPAASGLKNIVSIPSAVQKALHAPEFPGTAKRRERRQMNQELGELHRRQVDLHERITERLPDHRQLDDDTDYGLAAFAETQAEILGRLEQLLPKDLELYQENEVRRKKLAAQGAAALSELRQAYFNLHQGMASEAVESQQASIDSLVNLQAANKNHELAAAIGILTIVILVVWNLIPLKRLKVIPAALVAVLVSAATATLFQLPVLYIEIPSNLTDELHFLNWRVIQDAPWGGVLSSALFIAIVASAETLLSATAVDQMQTGPRTRYDKELRGQGIGNLVCGMLGALPVTGVVVRSGLNVQSGAQTRMSSFLHGLWLLLFVVALSSVLRMIPTSSMAAILVYVGYKLIDRKAIRNLANYGWGEIFIFSVTVLVIVFVDLLLGVCVGIALAILKLVLRFARLRIRVLQEHPDGPMVLRLQGTATFLRIPKLAKILEGVAPGAEVTLDVRGLVYIDHASLQLLETWQLQHESTGGVVHIDWAHLRETAMAKQPLQPAPEEDISNVA